MWPRPCRFSVWILACLLDDATFATNCSLNLGGIYPLLPARFSVQPLDEKNQSVGQPIQVTVTLLRDVQVLKAPVGTQSTTTGGAVAGGGNNQGANAEQFAMVAIKDRDVQRLVYSLENGKIWMSLRGDRATDSFQDKAQGGTPEPLIDSIASVIGAEKGFHLVPGDKGFNLVPSTGKRR